MTVHGMHHEASIEINASPEAVYALVSELPYDTSDCEDKRRRV